MPGLGLFVGVAVSSVDRSAWADRFSVFGRAWLSAGAGWALTGRGECGVGPV